MVSVAFTIFFFFFFPPKYSGSCFFFLLLLLVDMMTKGVDGCPLLSLSAPDSLFEEDCCWWSAAAPYGLLCFDQWQIFRLFFFYGNEFFLSFFLSIELPTIEIGTTWVHTQGREIHDPIRRYFFILKEKKKKIKNPTKRTVNGFLIRRQREDEEKKRTITTEKKNKRKPNKAANY